MLTVLLLRLDGFGSRLDGYYVQSINGRVWYLACRYISTVHRRACQMAPLSRGHCCLMALVQL